MGRLARAASSLLPSPSKVRALFLFSFFVMLLFAARCCCCCYVSVTSFPFSRCCYCAVPFGLLFRLLLLLQLWRAAALVLCVCVVVAVVVIVANNPGRCVLLGSCCWDVHLHLLICYYYSHRCLLVLAVMIFCCCYAFRAVVDAGLLC